jgi:hypothetical protein
MVRHRRRAQVVHLQDVDEPGEPAGQPLSVPARGTNREPQLPRPVTVGGDVGQRDHLTPALLAQHHDPSENIRSIGDLECETAVEHENCSPPSVLRHVATSILGIDMTCLERVAPAGLRGNAV